MCTCIGSYILTCCVQLCQAVAAHQQLPTSLQMCEFAVSSKLLCEMAIFVMGTPKNCIDLVWTMNANYLVWTHPQSGSIRFAVASEENAFKQPGLKIELTYIKLYVIISGIFQQRETLDIL